MHGVEIAVTGGGAAGIGALRTRADASRNALLLEASDRVGGRARTVHVDGMPLDLGAGWLHSAARNPWAKIAEAMRHATSDRASDLLPPGGGGNAYLDAGGGASRLRNRFRLC